MRWAGWPPLDEEGERTRRQNKHNNQIDHRRGGEDGGDDSDDDNDDDYDDDNDDDEATERTWLWWRVACSGNGSGSGNERMLRYLTKK